MAKKYEKFKRACSSIRDFRVTTGGVIMLFQKNVKIMYWISILHKIKLMGEKTNTKNLQILFSRVQSAAKCIF